MAELVVRDLSCERGGRELIVGLSFEVGRGRILQIEGANGAGKTTLLRTLCGLSHPQAGVVTWSGEDIQANPDHFRASMAYVGHAHAIKGELSVAENLRASSELSGSRSSVSIEEAVQRVGLAGYEHELCKTLSAGQRRRVALARLLIVDATVWVLDEPYTALDVDGVAMINAMIAAHVEGNGVVILSSHQAVKVPGAEVQRVTLAQ